MKKARKGAKNPNPGKVSPFLFGTCAIFIPQKAREWQPKKNREKPLPNGYMVIILYTVVVGIERFPLCPS
jgi:hypothetical protein